MSSGLLLDMSSMAGGRLCYCAVLEVCRATMFAFLGSCVVAQRVFDRQLNNDALVQLGWGLSYAVSSLLNQPYCEHFVTPVLAIAKLCYGRLRGCECLAFMTAHILGSFIGSALTYLVYYEAFHNLDKGDRMISGPLRTAHIFSGYPTVHLSNLYGFAEQLVAAFIFVFLSGSVNRHKNLPNYMRSFIEGLCLTLTLLAFSFNSTATINPAREVGGRMASFFFGYGEKVFSFRDFKWAPLVVVAPMAGAVLGAHLLKVIFLAEPAPAKKQVQFADMSEEKPPRPDFSALDELFAATMNSRML